MPSSRFIFAFIAPALIANLEPVAAVAAPVAGKWGLGVDTGDLLGSRAEGTVIVGRSERTAWLLYMSVSGSRSEGDSEVKYVEPDTLIAISDEGSGYSLTLGPGLRRYVRQTGRISAYLDGYTRFGRARFTSERSAGTFRDETGQSRWTAGIGFALGVEYFFERWPVSLAAHTNFLSLNYRWDEEERSRDSGDRARRTAEGLDISGGVGPRVQVRVYF